MIKFDDINFVHLANRVSAVYQRKLEIGRALNGLDFHTFSEIVEDICGDKLNRDQINDFIDILHESGLIDFTIRKARYISPGVSVVEMDVSVVVPPADPIVSKLRII